jgi:pimeloyl-ACP methyl ester carboxylesterase
VLERHQFRVLYKNFLRHIVDLELLSAHGDVSRLMAQFAALLASASFVLALMQTGLAYVEKNQLAQAVWSDEEFLLSTTMAVVGMFAVLGWDSVFPDRRDCLVLMLLPLRMRTIFKAKLAAVLTGLALCIVAANVFTSLSFAAAAYSGTIFLIGALRAFFAYWIAMAAAGVFVFASFMAVQGLAAQLLPYRLLARVSNALQLLAFFVMLGVYFLTPGSDDFSITDPNYHWIIQTIPSFWFVGLFQELHGAALPASPELAVRALWALGIAVTLAAAAYALSYGRAIRRMIEQPEIAPSDRRRPFARFSHAVAERLIPKPLERAVVLFVARTLARSRQHRVILAAYGGLGLAISLAFTRAFLYGGSAMYAMARRYGYRPPVWNQPNAAFMTAGFVMLFFVVIGTRAVFSLPATLKGNWLFRITAVHSPKAYFTAVRKSLYALAAWPILTAVALGYLSIWPRLPALGHVVVMTLAAVIVVERSLAGFRKIPFVCSYLPGQANLKLKLGAYGAGFLFAVYAAGNAERLLLQTPPRAIVLFAALIAAAILAHRKWKAFAADPYERLQFESVEPQEVAPLDLSHDGAYGRLERYVDVVNRPPEPTLRQRAKAIAFRTVIGTFAAATAGFLYEHVSERLHPLPPRIGARVDIGGRSLNIFCSGQGSPAVIFESGAGGPGLVWSHIQQEVAHFARACWYDRAGYGWSDPGPFPRDAKAIADDLHHLLHNAGVSPGFVLVGASFGGLIVRVYNYRYPREVAGLVLVDSSHVDNGMPIRPFGEGWLPYWPHAMSLFVQMQKQIGVLRLLMGSSGPSMAQTLAADPRTFAESSKELFYESLLEARASGNLGDRPLIVLTAGLPSGIPEDPSQARRLMASQRQWIASQTQLAQLSTRGKQIVLPDSRHAIQFDRPDTVISAVRDVVEEVRNGWGLSID